MSANESVLDLPVAGAPSADESHAATSMESHVGWLRSLGAHEVAHSGRTFIEHLTGTYALLKDWGCDETVAVAGLFHSIYGTQVFERSTLSFEQRGELRARIGERAEYLAYLFCSVERPGAFLSGLRTRRLANRFSNTQISIDTRTLHDLICIECANLIEQRGNKGFLSRIMQMPEVSKLTLPTLLKAAVNQYVQGVGSADAALASRASGHVALTMASIQTAATPGVVLNAAAARHTASRIRPATEADLVELVYLARELHADSRWQWTHFDKSRTVQQVRDWMGSSDGQIIVAQKGADIVGFVALRQESLVFTKSKIARVHFLYVQHRYRSVLALRLLHSAVSWARKKQVAELRLDDQYGLSAERNQRLFEKLALKRVGSCMSVWL